MAERCKCGAGVWLEGDTLCVQPHGLDCVKLREIVSAEREGWCTTCFARKIVERSGEAVYCPNGCSREMKGEAALELFDAAGSGWIRDELQPE